MYMLQEIKIALNELQNESLIDFTIQGEDTRIRITESYILIFRKRRSFRWNRTTQEIYEYVDNKPPEFVGRAYNFEELIRAIAALTREVPACK